MSTAATLPGRDRRSARRTDFASASTREGTFVSEWAAATRRGRRCGTIVTNTHAEARRQQERKLTTEFVRHDLAKTPSSGSEPDRVRVIREGVASYLPDIDPEETSEWLESFDELLERSGPARARYLMLRLLERAGEQRVAIPVADVDRLRQHHPHRAGTVVPRRRGRRTSLPGVDPVERRHHGAPRAAPGSRRGRPHFDLCLLGGALRGRLQPLLPRQDASRRRRPGLHPGPRLAGDLCARLPGRPAERRPARRLPPGAQPPRRRPAVLPAPAADAAISGSSRRCRWALAP